MNWNNGFRAALRALLLAAFLGAPGLAATASAAGEGTPPVPETTAPQEQPLSGETTTVQSAPVPAVREAPVEQSQTVPAAVESAPTVTMLTLSQCIEIALKKNPNILAAIEQVLGGTEAPR